MLNLRGKGMTCALCLRRMSFVVLTAAACAVVGRQHAGRHGLYDGALFVRQVKPLVAGDALEWPGVVDVQNILHTPTRQLALQLLHQLADGLQCLSHR